MPEEAPATETSEETPVEATAEAVPEAVETPAEPQEASPPDIHESLRQMQATQEELLSRIQPGQDDEAQSFTDFIYEEDPESGEQSVAPQTEGEVNQELAEFYRAVDERADAKLNEYRLEVERDRRDEALNDLGRKYPELMKPEVARAVLADAERAQRFLPEEFQNLPHDPFLVEKMYQAYKAAEAAAKETPAEAGGEQGATLETGAGPAQQVEEADPQVKGYMDAINGGRGSNAFIR